MSFLAAFVADQVLRIGESLSQYEEINFMSG